ncbi:MAG: outer membrane lipid asymmetry maintenance protein MlaD [Deltaproteobacteria bacterium]|nr:outer membrane lipid asymmetry maintenance protein MlaD [Deltaproteobacteria bacterium]
MKTFDREVAVGLTLILGAALLVYISLHLGNLGFGQTQGYTVQAEFPNAGGLQDGAPVELAGVEIGRVMGVTLTDTYNARITFRILPTVTLQEDSRAAIKSKGLIGERYVEIFPGKGTTPLVSGGTIRETEAPVDIQEVITKFIFGNIETDKDTSDEIQ